MNSQALIPPRSHAPKPIQVLIADPDESLQPVYREPLMQEGFEVDAAYSGLECVARLRERVPALLVLEPQLPWGGGDGVLALMGEVEELARVPVMVLTSSRDPQLLSRVSRFPVSGYHLKPLPPHRLAKRLRALLTHPRRRFTLAEQTGRLEHSIARRTGGRVRNLRVDAVEGRVIVRGRSDSLDVKQLALAALLEAFEASAYQSDRVELEIEVG